MKTDSGVKPALRFSRGATALMLVALLCLLTGCASMSDSTEDVGGAQIKVKPAAALLINMATDQGGDNPFIQLPEYTWILLQEIDQRIVLTFGEEQLLLHGTDGWYLGQNQVYTAEKKLDAPYPGSEGNDYLMYQYRIDTMNLAIKPLNGGTTINPLPEGTLFQTAAAAAWPYQWDTERVLYAGGGMVLVMQEHFETGGGTYNAGWYHLALRSVKSDYPGRELPLARFENPNVKKEIERLQQEYDQTIRQEQDDFGEIFISARQYVDIENAAPVFFEGGWRLGYILAEEYVHNGNGSYFRSMLKILPTSFTLPERIDPHSNTGVEKMAQLADEDMFYVASDGQIAVVVKDSRLLIYRLTEEGYVQQADARVPVGSAIIATYELTPEDVKYLADLL
jgi:hypothetical protein